MLKVAPHQFEGLKRSLENQFADRIAREVGKAMTSLRLALPTGSQFSHAIAQARDLDLQAEVDIASYVLASLAAKHSISELDRRISSVPLGTLDVPEVCEQFLRTYYDPAALAGRPRALD